MSTAGAEVSLPDVVVEPQPEIATATSTMTAEAITDGQRAENDLPTITHQMLIVNFLTWANNVACLGDISYSPGLLVQLLISINAAMQGFEELRDI